LSYTEIYANQRYKVSENLWAISLVINDIKMNIKAKNSEVAVAWYRISLTIAIILGIFSVIGSMLLVSNFIQLKSLDPLNSPEFAELKEQLSHQTGDESIKEQIRNLDLQLRSEYFRHREFSKLGAYLLLGSMAIFLIAIKSYEYFRKKLPMPQIVTSQDSEESRNVKISRWALVVIGLIIGGSAFALITNSEKDEFFRNAEQIVAEAKLKAQESNQVDVAQNTEGTPTSEAQSEVQVSETIVAQPEVALSQTPTYPTAEEIKKNWSRFRGTDGLGVSYYTNVPSSWNGKTGENVLWKTKIPLPGENSPVIWGKKIFLTGATDRMREIYCFDADTGKILWQKPVENIPESSPQSPKVSEDTGFAAPTTTTDGQRVYAIFANADLVSFDFDGNLVWSKNLGNPKSMYGYASSLMMYKNLLIVLYDQGGSDENLSSIMAFDGASGKQVWQTKRPVPNSWATPIIINTGKRDELITDANPYVIAYDPSNGNEFWRAKCLSGDVAPSPIYADGLVFATNAYASLAAIRPDGQGDVTSTNIVWSADSGLPDICSPLSDGKLLFLLQTYGLMTCYDVKTGKIVWENDFAETFKASPSLVGDNVFLLTDDGLMIIIKLDRQVKEVGRYELGEKTNCSPAFLDGRIYIRGKENLYCIGSR
jgi:outer membrane protein assembly factor BamB